MSNIQTNFILGEAGTAKTTSIINAIVNLNDFICLAYTHSAVNNLYTKYIKHPNHNENFVDNFKTIHSYFKINIDKYGQEIFRLNQNLDLPTYIFIDELSLIPLHIIEFIYTILNNNSSVLSDKKIILTFVGDLLQLNPINIEKHLIDINNFKILENFESNFQESLLIANHLSNNIFSTKHYRNGNKMILSKNFRSNDNVIKILNDVLNDINNINNHRIKLKNIDKYIKEKYTILSSKYEFLEYIYSTLDVQKTFKLKTLIGELYYDNNDKLLLTSNLNEHFTNGDIVIIKHETDDIIKIYKNEFEYTFEADLKKYPLLPLNMLTIHKAQGLTLKRVIVVLDDLFEITMLYTAITRASKNVRFLLLSKQNISQLKIYNQSFIKLRDIIYMNV